MHPTQITLEKDRTALVLHWPDGSASALSAGLLRRHCRSAGAKRQRIDGVVPFIGSDITIADVRPIGHYAINLVFSDGHDRGIYPWTFLRDLGENSASGN
jgi:DUF971 family protein